MTINGVEVRKPFAGDPAHARDMAAGYLVKIGYGLVDRSGERVHLKFAGRWFTSDPEEQTHHAYVRVADGALVFEFTTGIVASYWTDKDRAMADERATHAAEAAGATQGDPYRAGSGPAMRACPYCGKINLVAAPHCTCCGASHGA